MTGSPAYRTWASSPFVIESKGELKHPRRGLIPTHRDTGQSLQLVEGLRAALTEETVDHLSFGHILPCLSILNVNNPILMYEKRHARCIELYDGHSALQKV